MVNIRKQAVSHKYNAKSVNVAAKLCLGSLNRIIWQKNSAECCLCLSNICKTVIKFNMEGI
jgi:hypothetical protein